MATKLVGLDIGTTTMRAAEIEMSGRAAGNGPIGSLVKYAEVPMPPGVIVDGEVHETGTVATLVKQLWSKGGFSTKEVMVGVGSARTVVREMEVGSMPMDQLRKSLPFQVEEFLPMSTDEALLDFYPNAEVEGARGPALRGILVAATKHSISNTILAVEAAGLKPKGVDLRAFALERSLVVGQWEQTTVGLVDIGARTTTVAIIEAGMPRLIRMLPTGGHDVTDAIAAATQLPMGEAEDIKRRFGVAAANESGNQLTADAIMMTTKSLVDGIRNTLLYFTGNNAGTSIEHVILTGGGTMMPGLGQYLASACRLPVSYGNSVGVLKKSKKIAGRIRGKEALIAVAVGLAMGSVMS